MRVQNVRREGSSGRAKWALAAIAVGLVAAAIGCALGPEQEPGCHRDTDCGEGFACRAGACFRATTDRSSPATDAGDDAASDAD
jgi:hypothetical protein